MYYGWPSSQQDSTPQADDWNDSWQSSTSYASDWPVGTTCCVCSTSGNVRSGPSVDCDRVGYVNQGQEFEVLDISVADTGKDWYLIKGYFGEGWVSSGIVSVWLNGERYDLGTINRIPITN